MINPAYELLFPGPRGRAEGSREAPGDRGPDEQGTWPRRGSCQPAMTAGHGHDHGPALTATGRHRGRLAAVLAITVEIAVGEVIGAVLSGSLVLLADAAHMTADAAGVGLSLLAAYFAEQARHRAAHLRLRPAGDPGRDGERAAAARHGRVHPVRGGPAAGHASSR